MAPGRKIYPTVEQLKTVGNLIRCSEKGCPKIFTSKSNLLLHLVKTHRTHLMPPKEDREFHCPESKCPYHESKFFKAMKQIKQHYMKVHCSKDFICEHCSKGFPTELLRKGHADYCGAVFKCFDCGTQYPSYESLCTHTRRKRHALLEKGTFKTKVARKSASKPATAQNAGPPKTSLILPKTFIIILPIQAFDKSDSSTQTDPEETDEPKETFVVEDCLNMKTYSQETQTPGAKKPKLTVETQTVGDYSNNRRSNITDTLNTQIMVESSARISTKTQTNTVTSKSISCNTPFSYNHLDFTLTNNMEMNTSSTQTYADLVPNSSDVTAHDTFSDSPDPIGLNSNFDSNFFNCNMETQTDFMFDEELLSCDYYSHMHTQTCEDMLLRDIGFHNIETQTAFQDMLRSVESQTLMSHTKKNYPHCRDMSHTETQTDIEFQKMLEEINS